MLNKGLSKPAYTLESTGKLMLDLEERAISAASPAKEKAKTEDEEEKEEEVVNVMSKINR